MSRTVLVFGSTSTQGGGVVKAFASRNKPSPTYRILAVTRDPSSTSAKALTKLPGAECVKYDTSKPETLFKDAGELYGVFSVQNAFQDKEVEEGNAITDLAVKYNARHLVYSGIDFAGQNPTPIPFFETKRQVENHLKEATTKSSTRWTIIRPPRIMEDWTRPEYLDAAITEVDPKAKYKLVSGKDIGRVAVESIERSEDLNGEVIELAGDSQTIRESMDVWTKITGSGYRIKKPEELEGWTEKVVRFNAAHEFLADPVKCRKRFPFMQTFEEFVSEATQ